MARDITNIEDMTSNDQAPSREQAEEAVRTLIRWAGDNPEREGLIDTPARVTRAYEEFFKGYQQDPSKDGISKLARIVDIHAKRLVSQESMTRDIVSVIDDTLAPRGVAVLIDANHQCMSIRGVNKAHSSTVTSMFSGVFKEDAEVRGRFMQMIR